MPAIFTEVCIAFSAATCQPCHDTLTVNILQTKQIVRKRAVIGLMVVFYDIWNFKWRTRLEDFTWPSEARGNMLCICVYTMWPSVSVLRPQQRQEAKSFSSVCHVSNAINIKWVLVLHGTTKRYFSDLCWQFRVSQFWA